MTNPNVYKKATTFSQISSAIQLNVPISPDHEFYTNFSDVRGDFKDNLIYGSLNVDANSFTYQGDPSDGNNTIIFLAGMRGSGKTSELSKISKQLNKKDCFFCVTCNLDEGLNLNDMEYADILIFQLERLFEEIEKNKHIILDQDIIDDLNRWFEARVREVNEELKKEGSSELNIQVGTGNLLNFLGIATKLKDYIRGTQKTADTIRTIFKNNFTDFAKKFNQYVESVNMFLRKHEIAQKLLFIVDGLEKVNTHEIRKRIILEESNRFAQIKVNTIFTLPIELQMESRRLLTFSKVISFPFVKILEKNGNIVEKAVEKFTEFVYKRIDARLFDNPETVKTAILHCGGSPRELLRILEYTYLYANRNEGILKSSDLHNALKRLAAESSHYISEVDLSRLKKLKTANEQGEPVAFNEEWQNLIENSIIFEYNDGTFKRVNPIVEISELYKHYVR